MLTRPSPAAAPLHPREAGRDRIHPGDLKVAGVYPWAALEAPGGTVIDDRHLRESGSQGEYRLEDARSLRPEGGRRLQPNDGQLAPGNQETFRE